MPERQCFFSSSGRSDLRAHTQCPSVCTDVGDVNWWWWPTARNSIVCCDHRALCCTVLWHPCCVSVLLYMYLVFTFLLFLLFFFFYVGWSPSSTHLAPNQINFNLSASVGSLVCSLFSLKNWKGWQLNCLFVGLRVVVFLSTGALQVCLSIKKSYNFCECALHRANKKRERKCKLRWS